MISKISNFNYIELNWIEKVYYDLKEWIYNENMNNLKHEIHAIKLHEKITNKGNKIRYDNKLWFTRAMNDTKFYTSYYLYEYWY